MRSLTWYMHVISVSDVILNVSNDIPSFVFCLPFFFMYMMNGGTKQHAIPFYGVPSSLPLSKFPC